MRCERCEGRGTLYNSLWRDHPYTYYFCPDCNGTGNMQIDWRKIAEAYNSIKGSAEHELFWWKYSEECGVALNLLAKMTEELPEADETKC